MLLDWLCIWASFSRRDGAFAIVLAMPFGMLAFGLRLKQAKAGVVAGLLFYLAPVAGKDATVAYVDTGTAVVVFGAFYLLWLRRNTDCRAALIPAGLLAGYCYACKMTAGMSIPFALVFVISTEALRGNGWRRALKSGALTALLAGAIVAPWMVKNAVVFHDPFFPFLNRLFPNPHLYPLVKDGLRHAFSNAGNLPYLEFPWQITVGGKLLAIVGPAFLLAPVALLGLRYPAGRWCLLAFLIFLPPFFDNTDTRFLLPCLPFLALGIGIGLLSIPRIGAALGLACTIAFHTHGRRGPVWCKVFVPSFQWRIDLPDIRAALRIVPEKTWLDEHWHEYEAGLMLDRFVPPGDLVFSPNMAQIAYHHRNLVGSYDSPLAKRAFDLFLTPFTAPWANGWHRDIRFSPIVTSRIRLRSSVTTDNELRVNELRFFLGDGEIARRPDWRLTASRNPWEVQLAFDNDKVSWWTSGQTVDTQTWIEVDFPQPVRMDRVAVDQIEDQRWIGFATFRRGSTASGRR